MVPSIAIARPDPAHEAVARVRNMLADTFTPRDFRAAIDALAFREIYPAAASLLAGYVCGPGTWGRNSLPLCLTENGLHSDLRARRVAACVGLIRRQSGTSFSFRFIDLVEATAVAPLAWLALACLGYARGDDEIPIAYRFGHRFPPTRRERAALALWFLTRHAFNLRRGVL